MYKASLNSKELNQTDDIELEYLDLVKFTISNFGSNAIVIEIKGVERILAAGSIDNPSQLSDDCFGHPFDLLLKISFPNGQSRTVVDTNALLLT